MKHARRAAASRVAMAVAAALSARTVAWAQVPGAAGGARKGAETRAADAVTYEFVNRDITEILYAISLNRKIPILCDATVRGTASFRCAGADFETAFEAFLSANRLFAERGDRAWTVTRVLVSRDAEGFFSLDAIEVEPAAIMERLSSVAGVTVARDALPNVPVSVHLSGATLVEAIAAALGAFPDYSVAEEGRLVRVRKRDGARLPAEATGANPPRVTMDSGLFSAEIERAPLSNVLAAFFAAAGREYSSFARGDATIERLAFAGKTFAEAIGLILSQANAEWSESDGVCYVLPGREADILERLRNAGRSWSSHSLGFLSFADLQPILAARFPEADLVPLRSGNGFFLFATDGEREGVVGLALSLDAAPFAAAVRLRYISTADLIARAPPSVSRENLVDSGDGTTVFFRGTRERFSLFEEELAAIDRPRTRIRYDLLIVQYQETSELKWGFDVSARRLAPGDQTLVTGSLGNILKLNFDVVSVLGYQFAARLDAALAENQANVFADTTLYGLSGDDVKFQNTNTFRYRDYYIDSETQKTVYTGVTREIVSGLVLSVNGWASGDGMVTTSVTASVSKRGADVSPGAGNPPPTSEKTITTRVRSRSGETVVLSGLRQDDSTLVEERIPWISRIPVLGWLFRNRASSGEKTQTVIYLIPHAETDLPGDSGESARAQSAYERLVAPFAAGVRAE